MHIEPALPRFSLERLPGALKIAIPARRNWFIILFFSAWMIGWWFGESTAVRQLLNHQKPTSDLFMIAWLAGWTCGGIFAVTTVLWQLFGQELIVLDASGLRRRVEIFGIGRNWSYATDLVTHLRCVDQPPATLSNQASWRPPLFGNAAGPVAFDYGARSVRMAPALDEAEARLIVAELNHAMPPSPNRTGEAFSEF